VGWALFFFRAKDQSATIGVTLIYDERGLTSKGILMLTSMTGFARASAETPAGTLTCELRAVNHRFLDVQFRLPEELRGKEVELRQQIGTFCKRGKVECSIHIRRSSAEGAQLRLNENLVRQIGRAVEELSDLLPGSRKVDPVDVLRWPGVVEEPIVDTDPLFAAAVALLKDTLQSLNGMRSSEGERIAAMLESRCADILGIAKTVRKRMPEVLQAVRERQRERIDKLNVEADPARLETELALIAQKLDVDEELDRLESHVSEIRSVLAGNEPVGRKLDFLMQELNREANTLGSKSADTETTSAAVELKVLIEQMREQIQNVE
jgi:uncharacterized protein (TIGR00255 family)